VNSDDAVVAFSFPRYSTTVLKGGQYCSSAGATVIGLTDSKLSPLAQVCDHVLLAKSDMVSLVDSLVAPLSVVNALIVGVTARRSAELAKRLDMLENIWSDYDVYEKRSEKQ
jgi:DNA-binding MurR/RpiR family transcriptional regulator